MPGTALLLSGGIDSTAIACWLRPDLSIFVNYGQKAAGAELEAASAVASTLGLRFETIIVDAASLGSGTMAGTEQLSFASSPEWWPFRNQFLITVAAMKMTSTGQERLLIGTVSTDVLHGDGSEAFLLAVNRLLAVQEGRFQVSAPASNMTTTELVRQSGVPDNIIAWTHSCHASNRPCGKCRGCDKRDSVLHEIGYPRGT